MTPQTSTLFLNNITQIDYAELNTDKWIPTGSSVHLNVKVTGFVDSHENVVVDFSKIKKTIKGLIDHKSKGFDHKMWLPLDLATYQDVEVYEEDGEIQIIAPNFETIVPNDAIRYVDPHNICGYIEAFLDSELATIYPKVRIKTNVWLNQAPWIPDQMKSHAAYFRYVHGLKNSSSWGCQNINHGHLSWIAVIDDKHNGVYCNWFPIKRIIDDAVFVWEENIVGVDNNFTSVRYTTPQRGFFETTYGPSTNIIKLKTETTVENLAVWFVDFFKNNLKSSDMIKSKACGIWMSEGLAKGAVEYF